ncbi:beta-1,4-glucuronyltransferase 1-like isoform X2 [Portunus trituberculatus]|uniref:beta-1,4-glucuronyltransferase 1-like isoform X2 n=1 Tax=Portunus trituberculatus TaxID=210409 RepID=UPI001E1CFDA3|nr:beta-1,4-glucuronyltransferase 1-like isoform X2 [Portunus trituberculatus]
MDTVRRLHQAGLHHHTPAMTDHLTQHNDTRIFFNLLKITKRKNSISGEVIFFRRDLFLSRAWQTALLKEWNKCGEGGQVGNQAQRTEVKCCSPPCHQPVRDPETSLQNELWLPRRVTHQWLAERGMFPRFLTSIISWRSVAVLALTASLLQITNIVLTWQLKQRHLLYAPEAAEVEETSGQLGSKRHHHHHSADRRGHFHLGPKVSDDHQATLSRIAHWSVLDGSGEFRVSGGVLRGTAQSMDWVEQDEARHHDLTLVTQCSLSRLHKLPPLAVHWQGPLSIAVFVLSGEVQAAVQTFHLLRKCYPSVKENVTFSLVFPLNSPTSPHIIPTANTTPCHKIFSPVHQDNYSFNGVQYPNNLLRNVARKATTTSHMMVVDVDITPNSGLHKSFLSFAKRKGLFKKFSKEKTVWVLPAYEVKNDAGIPETKEQLLTMKKKGLARPFYQELCLKCQKFTDYPAWEKEKAGRSGLSTAYEVLWQSTYEPFYIASTKIPLYDERFRQYGFNRISQVCELHVAGFRFLVLDSAFVIHEGFKTVDSFHTTKDAEQEKNNILFRHFKAELKIKYPESSRSVTEVYLGHIHTDAALLLCDLWVFNSGSF